MDEKTPFYMLPPEQVTAEFKVDPSKGLTKIQVEENTRKYGLNQVPEPEGTPFITLVIKQFQDLLVLILLGAAVISFVLAIFEETEDQLTAFFEPAVILLILIANATVGVIQETDAEKSIDALRKSEAQHATVIRDGMTQTIAAADLVPGDIVVLEVGDKIPADCRLLQVRTACLEVEQAILTGEDHAVAKQTAAITTPVHGYGEQRNMLFSGTLVGRGKAVAVVVSTGTHTAMGQIARDIAESEEEKTPLQEKLDEFGELLSIVIGIICLVVWLINIGHFTDPEHGSWFKGAIYYFKVAVALAVAAIPEGLPAVVTTCLALGTIRMAKKNAIVRSLPSVETLGCTTVICSDKTGTLTANKMSVDYVITLNKVDASGVPDLQETLVKGDSFAPFGEILQEPDILQFPAVRSKSLAKVSQISVLCNEAMLEYLEDPRLVTEESKWSKTGTPTEAALKVLGEKLGVPDEKEQANIFEQKDPMTRALGAHNWWNKKFEREHLLEFDRNRKSMSVVMIDSESQKKVLLCKGQPKRVIERCDRVFTDDGAISPLNDVIRTQIDQAFSQKASRGYRIMALAYLEEPDENQDWQNIDNYPTIESKMVFVGLVCMRDPPRLEVREAIAKCHKAGIRVIVVTGDEQKTAEAICRDIGIFGADEDLEGRSFRGQQLQALKELPEEERVAKLRNAHLFAEVIPRDKKELVNFLKEKGEVTAMTGDGVNDAPALSSANIGISMGSGTDVAREASHMVLQDDNFATIVMAVEEGRSIYQNTRQFIRYLISSNIGEVACIFLTAAIGMPEALIPVQLLWVNLVTDGLPATALGFNPPDPDIMERPPRRKEEPIVNGWTFFRYMIIGIYVGVGTILGFMWWYLYYSGGPGITFQQLTNFGKCESHSLDFYPMDFDCNVFHDPRPSTISLSILVTIEMFNALNALSENQSLLVVPPWSNIWVVLAVLLSFVLHFIIVYVPWFSSIFHVAALNIDEWSAVIGFSFPVIVIDEILKYLSRNFSARQVDAVKED